MKRQQDLKTDLRCHELWGATTVDGHISFTLDFNIYPNISGAFELICCLFC